MKKQMTQSFKQWKMILFMIMPLLISLACLTPTSIPATAASDSSTAAPESGAVSAEVNVNFGPGPFDFPDTRAGLVELSSYKATLIMSFDGTRDGQTQQWSKTYVMLSTKEPATLQLTIEKTGDLTDLDPVFMAEADGADYERRGENACTANVIEEGNSLGDRLEPAGFLTFVLGAEEAGAETVNDVAANHYTFDERASGQLDIAQSTGEMWVASDGGYIVKYLLTTKGNADYFGEGIEGTLTLDYELTDVNQPVAFALPDDCPAGLVDVPLLPDAADVVNMPGLLTYNTVTPLSDVAAFYQEEIPGLGWALLGEEPTITESTAFLDYQQGDQNLTVIITTDAGVTTVTILLEDIQL
ncbi:MAG: hypothetical protein IH589_00150 [Anaerolineales bacterium]|nr:hypothetical protein [Anaerolineales bacterium]